MRRLLLLAACLLLSRTPASAQNAGDLLPWFGDGGRVPVRNSGNIFVQSDGRIIVWTSTELERFHADGTIDLSFGTNGVFTSPVVNTQLFDVGEDAQHRLLLGYQGPKLLRVTADGQLDTSYGSNGVVESGGGEVRGGAFERGTGRFGFSFVDGSTCCRVRILLPDGTTDPSFVGGNPLPYSYGWGQIVRFRPGGGIAVMGSMRNVDWPGQPWMFRGARFSATGALDSTFEGSEMATGMEIDAGDSVVTLSSPPQMIYMAKVVVTKHGQWSHEGTFGPPDTSVRSAGKLTVDILGYPILTLVAGGEELSSRSILVRLTPGGDVDCSFGDNGEVIAPSGEYFGALATAGRDILVIRNGYLEKRADQAYITTSDSVAVSDTSILASVVPKDGVSTTWTIQGGVAESSNTEAQFVFTPSGKPGDRIHLSVDRALSCGTETSARDVDIDFNDVRLDNAFHDFVNTIARNDITAGCGGGNYCPDSSVTRAQMAVFLTRGKHGSAFVPPTATGEFSDVPPGSFAADFIEQIYADGISGGCGDGNYCPESAITRAQMAVFLLRAKHGPSYVPPTATGVFADAPPGSFAADWIEQLAAEGITGGCGGGNYCPGAPVSRAQMAVFLTTTFALQ
jgi:uncharacterized delta-60 repeat protein